MKKSADKKDDKLFIRRRLPSSREVTSFQRLADEEVGEEIVDESLMEVYKDDNGRLIDVRKLKIKHKRGWKFYLVAGALYVVVLGVLSAGIYYFTNWRGADSGVNLGISAPDQVMAGEDFVYLLKYNNLQNTEASNLTVHATFPDGFIPESSVPTASTSTLDNWELGSVGAHRGGEIAVHGRLFNKPNVDNVINAEVSYQPADFSTIFKATSTFKNTISDSGWQLSAEPPTNLLINEVKDLTVHYQPKDLSYVDNLRLTIAGPPALVVKLATSTPDGLISVDDGTWTVSSSATSTVKLAAASIFHTAFKAKSGDSESVKLLWDTKVGEKFYPVDEQDLSLAVVSNSLNLNLLLNNSSDGGSVNFGDTLHYTVNYNNQGSELKDVMLLAVLDGNAVDFGSLTSVPSGQIDGKKIIWNQDQVPDLADIAAGATGSLNFTAIIKKSALLSANFQPQIKVYTQFTTTGTDTADPASRSNTITSQLNSDLNLDEQIRYFTADNLAVGSGPMPPQVGQKTSLKVFWKIINTQHDLSNVQVTLNLPDNIIWDGRDNTGVGSLAYDEASHQISWTIGSLPANFSNANADFNIALTPTDSDQGKLMIISPGAKITAHDNQTGQDISLTGAVKTSKLEDDDIAPGNGLVQ